ncbi:MAG: hypothetical protein U0794_03410 [Isosphaeraceae bacterium]
MNVNLASTIGGTQGDAQADTVIVNGTNGNDIIDVFGAGSSFAVVGLSATVNVTNSEGANDALVVNAGWQRRTHGLDRRRRNHEAHLRRRHRRRRKLRQPRADVLIGGDNNDFVLGKRWR